MDLLAVVVYDVVVASYGDLSCIGCGGGCCICAAALRCAMKLHSSRSVAADFCIRLHSLSFCRWLVLPLHTPTCCYT